jgi:GR25 family glycosyltransferase involved in LPS biosynthesis
MTTPYPSILYVINLARSLDRMDYIRTEIDQSWPLQWERFPAIDGREFNLVRLRQAGVVKEAGWLRRLMTPGEVGAWLSHRGVWRLVAGGTLASALIIEDDVKFADGFLSHLGGRLAEVNYAFPDWDICYLGCMENLAPWAPSFSSADRLPGGFARMTRANKGCPGAYAYLLRPQGALRLLAHLAGRPIEMPIDEVAPRMCAAGELSVLCCSPPLIHNGRAATGCSFESTIRPAPSHVPVLSDEPTCRLIAEWRAHEAAFLM